MLLEKVQNSFTGKLLIRTIGGFRYDQIPCSKSRDFNLGLSSLAERRRRFDLIMIYKILYGYTDLKQEMLFSTRESVTRGTSRKLVRKRARKNIRKHFLVNRAGPDFEALIKKSIIPNKLVTFMKILAEYVKS
ncbi:hypothetical protein Y032_0323g2495 [Ancylostoma ceylanicum]|uniref:Uncharacterized protein n=1 Tax=Ancylostoma ceylanicum TaxID=53326 RepID=A0A016S0G8_9BILA|nr:hypothetical protein Y032_0323g2495 [Ancylostoma ceylanicum]